MDSFEKRIRFLFSQCRRGEVQGAQADSEFFSIRKDYYKALEDADEKVQLANQMYDLLDRYLRRLDSELFKFKCELEADHNGITEILEKRSLEMDGTSNSNNLNATSQKENRYFGLLTSASTPNNNHHSPMTTSSQATARDRYRPKPEKRRNSSSSVVAGSLEKRQNISSTVTIAPPPPPPPQSTINVRPTTPTTSMVLPTVAQPTSVSYNLHIGAGNAIAAAASQAIAATQQMQQGRRTASLKASYEAIHGTTGGNAHELLIGRELAGAAHNAIQAVEREGSTFNQSQRRQKKYGFSFKKKKKVILLLKILYFVYIEKLLVLQVYHNHRHRQLIKQLYYRHHHLLYNSSHNQLSQQIPIHQLMHHHQFI